MARPTRNRTAVSRAVIALSGAAAMLFSLSTPPTRAQAPETGPPFAPGEVLVQFKSEATADQRQAAVRRVAGVVRESLAPAGEGIRAESVYRLQTGRSVAEAVAALGGDGAVAFAEPNWVVSHQATSNDQYFTSGSLWGMYGNASVPSNTYGSQAAEAWANGHTGSSSVVVGVIDEGIDLNHPDLAANVWTNPFETPDNALDDDGNGFIDDIHGWDFWHKDNSIYDGNPGDSDGCTDDHGTHVSGTIGGVGNNGIGVAGVNWSVTLISGKFLGPNGGYISDAVRAVNYFTDLKTRHGVNIVALNNSWGGGGYSQAMHDAVIRAAKQGILFIAAAGNSGANNDKRASYPSNYRTTAGTSSETAAGYDSVLAVAAIASNGSRPRWSSYGATTVDLGAPGVGIRSTTPKNSYSSYDGTSMATPHVTGAAALYASTLNASTITSETAATIRSAILTATLPTSSLSGKTVTGGRLNVEGF